jgi:hypothetical protein
MPRRRGRKSAKGFVTDYEILNAETTTATGGSAVSMRFAWGIPIVNC